MYDFALQQCTCFWFELFNKVACVVLDSLVSSKSNKQASSYEQNSSAYKNRDCSQTWITHE